MDLQFLEVMVSHRFPMERSCSDILDFSFISLLVSWVFTRDEGGVVGGNGLSNGRGITDALDWMACARSLKLSTWWVA